MDSAGSKGPTTADLQTVEEKGSWERLAVKALRRMRGRGWRLILDVRLAQSATVLALEIEYIRLGRIGQVDFGPTVDVSFSHHKGTL